MPPCFRPPKLYHFPPPLDSGLVAKSGQDLEAYIKYGSISLWFQLYHNKCAMYEHWMSAIVLLKTYKFQKFKCHTATCQFHHCSTASGMKSVIECLLIR